MRILVPMAGLGRVKTHLDIAGVPTLLGAGYHALSWDYESGDFKWDVIQHGPIIGAALRF